MNILLIEDDKMLLRMLTKNLEDHGHRVFGAGDGREAVDLALENEVDAIVCDLMMPVISGVTFLHSREKFMPPDIPVIVISGLEEGENVLKSLDVKYRYFLEKPVDMERLLYLLDKTWVDRIISGSKENLLPE